MNLLMRLGLPLFLVTGAATVATACSCAFETEEFNYSVRRFPLVLTGKVIRVDRVNNSTGRFVSASYRFVVTKSWRGGLTDTVTLNTGASNCHVLLKKHRRYVLYLNPDNEVSICNRIVERRGKVRAEVKKLDAYFSEQKPLNRSTTN